MVSHNTTTKGILIGRKSREDGVIVRNHLSVD